MLLTYLYICISLVFPPVFFFWPENQTRIPHYIWLSCFFHLLYANPLVFLCLLWLWYLKCTSQIEHTSVWGYQISSPDLVEFVHIWWEYHRNDVDFSVYHIRRDVMSVCLITHDNNFDNLVMFASARFLWKVIILPFVINNYFMGKWFKTSRTSCFLSYLC